MQKLIATATPVSYSASRVDDEAEQVDVCTTRAELTCSARSKPENLGRRTGRQRFAGIEPSLQAPEDLLAESVPTLLRFRNIRNWVPLPVSEPFLATIQIKLAVDDRPSLGIGSGEFPIDDRPSAKPAEARCIGFGPFSEKVAMSRAGESPPRTQPFGFEIRAAPGWLSVGEICNGVIALDRYLVGINTNAFLPAFAKRLPANR